MYETGYSLMKTTSFHLNAFFNHFFCGTGLFPGIELAKVIAEEP